MPKGVYVHKPLTKDQKLARSLLAKKLGFGKWMLGQKRDPSVGRKISVANKGKKWIYEQKQRFSALVKGDKSHLWKGGKCYDGRGYIQVVCYGHPAAKKKTGYVVEHRLVMEKFLGRYLLPREVVHHINGVRDDNRLENLMLFSNFREHLDFHKKVGVKSE